MTAPLPTEAELEHARQILARHECHAAGHDFGIETSEEGEPLRVMCSRPCGHGPWTITPDDPRFPGYHRVLSGEG